MKHLAFPRNRAHNLHPWGPGLETGEIVSMRLGTTQTLHKKSWQWMKNQIAQDVPASDGLCEYDCRKQQCAEEEWAICERRIRSAAGKEDG